MTDYILFQIKDLKRLNCSLIITDLFYMFLSVSQFLEIIEHVWLHSERNTWDACNGLLYWITIFFSSWVSSESNHDRHFKVLAGNHFLFIFLYIFVTTWGQRLPEASGLINPFGIWTPNHQISSQMPWTLGDSDPNQMLIYKFYQ